MDRPTLLCLSRHWALCAWPFIPGSTEKCWSLASLGQHYFSVTLPGWQSHALRAQAENPESTFIFSLSPFLAQHVGSACACVARKENKREEKVGNDCCSVLSLDSFSEKRTRVRVHIVWVQKKGQTVVAGRGPLISSSFLHGRPPNFVSPPFGPTNEERRKKKCWVRVLLLLSFPMVGPTFYTLH